MTPPTLTETGGAQCENRRHHRLPPIPTNVKGRAVTCLFIVIACLDVSMFEPAFQCLLASGKLPPATIQHLCTHACCSEAALATHAAVACAYVFSCRRNHRNQCAKGNNTWIGTCVWGFTNFKRSGNLAGGSRHLRTKFDGSRMIKLGSSTCASFLIGFDSMASIQMEAVRSQPSWTAIGCKNVLACSRRNTINFWSCRFSARSTTRCAILAA